ncbi:MAG: D-glycero-beta-D-manno-heptose 1-phosphate adenylyltransferase [Ignavibacteria bacterium]|nr:D-glycero-beta-D-manno-heptose 1-phosphate adenylyltransferase [Ignavibacteria bacterium]
MSLDLEKILTISRELKKEGKKIVFTNGCFDIIHKGHIIYLKEAKKLGDYLIVGLNSDESVRRIKGNFRPINKQEDRALILENLKPVDAVVIFNEETPINLIEKIKPDFLVKGGDWKENEIVGADFVKSYGGKVISINYIENYSTTSLIEKIKNY